MGKETTNKGAKGMIIANGFTREEIAKEYAHIPDRIEMKTKIGGNWIKMWRVKGGLYQIHNSLMHIRINFDETDYEWREWK